MHEVKLQIPEQTSSCYAELHKFNYACFSLSSDPPICDLCLSLSLPSLPYTHIQTSMLAQHHNIHRTDGAVLSIPARAAFTLAVLAGTMFAAARVACPLIARGTHPTLLAAAAARYADAVAATVRRTKLCWSAKERE